MTVRAVRSAADEITLIFTVMTLSNVGNHTSAKGLKAFPMRLANMATVRQASLLTVDRRSVTWIETYSTFRTNK